MNEPDVPVRPSRLERIRAELAKHNWLSVGIEILIVTLGVLLAFEIEQWGQRRERAQQERQFLERLYVENQRAAREMQTLAEDHRKVIREYRLGLAARDDPKRLQAFARQEDFGCALFRFREAPFNDTSYEELVAAGRINLISDPALRNEIRDLAAAQAASARQIQWSRSFLQDQVAGVDTYSRLDMEPSGEVRCSVDWPALIRDRTAVRTAVRTYRVHVSTLEGREEIVARIKALQARLACKLGKPECRR